MKVCICFAASLVFPALMLRFGGSEIIPEHFPVRDLSQYTVRFLSENGSDTDSCLFGQMYPPDTRTGTAQYCGSLSYALTGGYDVRSGNKSNVIVLILPGSYPMGERGIEISHYQNIILSKMPSTSGEVVVKCNKFLEDDYNNFYVVGAVNFALNGIIFSDCGSYSSPARIQDSLNVVVSNCIFR